MQGRQEKCLSWSALFMSNDRSFRKLNNSNCRASPHPTKKKTYCVAMCALLKPYATYDLLTGGPRFITVETPWGVTPGRSQARVPLHLQDRAIMLSESDSSRLAVWKSHPTACFVGQRSSSSHEGLSGSCRWSTGTGTDENNSKAWRENISWTQKKHEALKLWDMEGHNF